MLHSATAHHHYCPYISLEGTNTQYIDTELPDYYLVLLGLHGVCTKEKGRMPLSRLKSKDESDKQSSSLGRTFEGYSDRIYCIKKIAPLPILFYPARYLIIIIYLRSRGRARAGSGLPTSASNAKFEPN